jgi:predicted solute-binding protein
MDSAVRIGAVSYLNTRPLVYGMQDGPCAQRVRLSYATPAVLADRLAAGELDVALLPVVELARIAGLELVPGLGIVTYGPSRSVLLVSNGPPDAIESIALDPDSRTSNALARVLLAEVWKRRPRILSGGASLAASLGQADAAVRIGDKALFDRLPSGAHVQDLGEVWTNETRLPFVFAAWAARPGVVDRDLYRLMHDSRRAGSRAIDRIAAEFTWNGSHYPDVAREYLTEHIRFRLGSDELRAMELFFGAAHRLGVIDELPQVRLALQRWTTCHEVATRLETGAPTTR